MNPWIVLSSAIIAMILSGKIAYSYFYQSPYVFAWLWFNLWIAIYEIYIVVYRKELTKKRCQPGFWSRDTNILSFWKEAWNEYTCYSDERYLDPTDFVFVIEFMNALLIIGLWFAYVFKRSIILYLLLAIQGYHCILYFISLYHSKKTNTQYPWKTFSYLMISALWVILPILFFMTNTVE